MDPKFFSFCSELKQLVSSRRAQGRNGNVFDGVEALSSDNNLITLRNLCLRLKPERTLEIGMCFGGSAMVFAASHRDLGRQEAHQHMALDPFQTSIWDDAGVFVIERAGLQGFLDFRPAFSSIELPRLVSENARFDFVYVDGSHLFEDVFIDFYYVARLLCNGGIIAFDDCTDSHVAKVIAFVIRNLSTSFKEVDLGQYRLDGGRSLRYKIAKVLGKTQLRAFKKIGPAERSWDAFFTKF